MKRVAAVLPAVLCGALLLSAVAWADEIDDAAVEGRVWYLGETVNSGHDTGYAEENPITDGDPHFGWTLGSFFVSGHTAQVGGDVPVFLKNPGDQVELWFRLEQSIDMLNGDESLKISEDTDGYDQIFQIEKTNFGRGALIVRHTDYQNASSEPTVYTDYLKACSSEDANTQIGLFEEGDYEVALDYEVVKENTILFVPVPATYNDYKITFEFKVRNGNSMAYLFDLGAGEELFDRAVVSDGFRIDTAGSHYLNVAVKREVMNEEGSGLTEVRINVPADDGSEFTDEGVYTVTIKNPSTGENTTKQIYVGTDRVLKAVVANTATVEEVLHQVEQGAEIAEDGTLKPPAPPFDSPVISADKAPNSEGLYWVLALVGCVVLAGAGVLVFASMRKKQGNADGKPGESFDEVTDRVSSGGNRGEITEDTECISVDAGDEGFDR